MMKRKFIAIVMAVLFMITFAACNAKCQEAESIVEEPSLGYVDESDLIQRVDDLTEAVNTHTDQISELDKKILQLETAWKDYQAKTAAPVRRNLLGTELKKPSKLSSGSTGSLNSVIVTPSIAPPVVTYSQPAYTIPAPALPAFTQPVSTQFSPQQFTTSRTVRRPVQQIRTTSVQYAPAQNQSRLGSRLGNFFSPGNCPGGICPR